MTTLLDTARARAPFTSAFGAAVTRADGTTVLRCILKPERVVTLDGVASYSGSEEQTVLWVDPAVDPPFGEYEHVSVGGEAWIVQPGARTHVVSRFVQYTLTRA